MKVKAIGDAPERMWQDLADIGFLLRLENVDREEARGWSRYALASRRNGVKSNEPSDRVLFDLLAEHVPTTRLDVDVSRRLRRESAPSWLSLSSEEIEGLLPPGALNRRPPTPSGARPFTLP